MLYQYFTINALHVDLRIYIYMCVCVHFRDYSCLNKKKFENMFFGDAFLKKKERKEKKYK